MRAEIDLSQPRRQSNVAILLFVYKFYKRWGRALLPALIAMVAGGTPWWVFFVLFAIGAAFGMAAFFRHRFHLRDGHLHVKKGVFVRSQMAIPFERIQSINFKQSLLHQIFDVVQLEIDTAGSDQKEFEIMAVSRNIAEALRQMILRHHRPSPTLHTQTPEAKAAAEKPTTIFKLNPADLLKVGLTRDHRRTATIPLAIYLWLQENLRQAHINLDKITEKYVNPEKLINTGIIVLGILVLVYTIFSVLLSLILTVVRYFDLTLQRTTDGFTIQYGLISKRHATIKDQKIQLFRWYDTLLSRLARLYDLQIRQASSDEVKRRRSVIHVPGVKEDHIRRTLDYYFQGLDYRPDQVIPVSKRWAYRRWTFLGIAVALHVAALLLFPEIRRETANFWIFLFWIYLAIVIGLQGRKKAFRVNHEVLHLHGGTFARSNHLLQLHKLQGVRLTQTPYQRRNQLASLLLFNAAGTTKIPYLPLNQAKLLRDYLLYRIETDPRPWM